jgi:hypothetical protein
MENVIVLAGNAQEHPTQSLIIGIIVVAVAVAFVLWLIGKVFK